MGKLRFIRQDTNAHTALPRKMVSQEMKLILERERLNRDYLVTSCSKTQNMVKSFFKISLSPVGPLRTRAGSFKKPAPPSDPALAKKHSLSPDPEPDPEAASPSPQG